MINKEKIFVLVKAIEDNLARWMVLGTRAFPALLILGVFIVVKVAHASPVFIVRAIGAPNTVPSLILFLPFLALALACPPIELLGGHADNALIFELGCCFYAFTLSVLGVIFLVFSAH